MAEIGTAEAASALTNQFGAQLEAGHDEGRNLMADALHKQFGISIRAAQQLVDDLEQARTIRWITHHPGGAPADRTIGRVPGVGILDGEGYWQLVPA